MIYIVCAASYLIVSSVLGACPHVIPRHEWSARPAATQEHVANPVHYTVIHHSAGPDCHERASCQVLVQRMQIEHMDNQGWQDIGYNFIIGGDGSIFEDRGWDKRDAHAATYGSSSYSFCFLGTFNSHIPTTSAQQVVKELLQCGVQLGKLSTAYSVKGHRDVPGANTDCPGTAFYDVLKSWPHYN